jgi:hypothetical protein
MVTDFPNPDAPEFAGLHADLGRLYIRHKADMDMADWSDDEIIRRVNVITTTLILLSRRARANEDREWLRRHRWFLDACDRLFVGGDAVALDG